MINGFFDKGWIIQHDRDSPYHWLIFDRYSWFMRFLSRIVLILTLVIPVLSWGNLDGKKELLEAFVAHSKFKGLIVMGLFLQMDLRVEP